MGHDSPVGTDQERQRDPPILLIGTEDLSGLDRPDVVTGGDAGGEVAGKAVRPAQPILLDDFFGFRGVLAPGEADQHEPRVAAEGLLDFLEHGRVDLPSPGFPEVEQDQLPSIIAELEPPAFLRDADPLDVEIRGDIADLDHVEEPGGDRAQVEWFVRPAAGDLGHGHRHLHAADLAPGAHEPGIGRPIDGELQLVLARGHVLDAEPAVLVGVRREQDRAMPEEAEAFRIRFLGRHPEHHG